MINSNILKFVIIILMIFFLFPFISFAQSHSLNYKIFTGVLDESGGRAQSASYFLRIGTGGQPSVVDISKESNLWAQQGYVHTASFVHGDDNAMVRSPSQMWSMR